MSKLVHNVELGIYVEHVFVVCVLISETCFVACVLRNGACICCWNVLLCCLITACVKIRGTEKAFDSLLLPLLRPKSMKSVFGDLFVSTRVYLDAQ